MKNERGIDLPRSYFSQPLVNRYDIKMSLQKETRNPVYFGMNARNNTEFVYARVWWHFFASKSAEHFVSSNENKNSFSNLLVQYFMLPALMPERTIKQSLFNAHAWSMSDPHFTLHLLKFLWPANPSTKKHTQVEIYTIKLITEKLADYVFHGVELKFRTAKPLAVKTHFWHSRNSFTHSVHACTLPNLPRSLEYYNSTSVERWYNPWIEKMGKGWKEEKKRSRTIGSGLFSYIHECASVCKKN